MKMQKERIKSVEVKMEPTLQLNEHINGWHKGIDAPGDWSGSVFSQNCVSWYKMGTADGPVWLWSGGVSKPTNSCNRPEILLTDSIIQSPSYLATNKYARYEDYNIKYKSKNQWSL